MVNDLFSQLRSQSDAQSKIDKLIMGMGTKNEVHDFLTEKLSTLMVISQKQGTHNNEIFEILDYTTNQQYLGCLNNDTFLLSREGIKSITPQDTIYFLELKYHKISFISIQDGVINISKYTTEKIKPNMPGEKLIVQSDYYDSDATKYILSQQKYLTTLLTLKIPDNLLPDVSLISQDMFGKKEIRLKRKGIDYIHKELTDFTNTSISICAQHFYFLNESGLLNELKTLSSTNKSIKKQFLNI